MRDSKPPYHWSEQLKLSWSARVQEWLYREQPSACATMMASVVRIIERKRRRQSRQLPCDVPTVVVGSLSVGGAGKTPVSMFIAERLMSFGKVSIVCRGWGGAYTHARLVHGHDPTSDGDEACLLRHRLTQDIDVWAGRDLVDARAKAAQSSDFIVVDDGFQTHALPSSIDIVVMDATAPTALLPAGPLRQPLGVLKDADLIWLNKVNEPAARRLPMPWRAAVRSEYYVSGVFFDDGCRLPASWLSGRRVGVWTGIGRPQSFANLLRTAGAIIEDGYIDIDHRSPAMPISREVTWVTTEKDWARGPVPKGSAIVRLGIKIVDGRCLLDEALKGLSH